MRVYIATVKRLVAAGYPKDKAVLAVYAAFGLSPEQVTLLQHAV